jgi:hypothetical protein
VIRKVSADFCANAGAALAPSSTVARIAAPNLNCTPISSSFDSDFKTDLKHTLCRMELYHSLGRADHGRWCHSPATSDRDAAARVYRVMRHSHQAGLTAEKDFGAAISPADLADLATLG